MKKKSYNFSFVTLVNLFFTSFSIFTYGQEINSTNIVHDFEGYRYFRLNYDNDFFMYSDDDYTQGLNFELVHPVFRKNPINFLFFKSKGGNYKYGLAIEHSAFTPDVISDIDIRYTDRPYASALTLKMMSVSDHLDKGSRMKSSFWLGIIGPSSLGGAGQTWIHEATGNWKPRGWDNQIVDDVMLNYNLGFETLLLNFSNYFSLYGESKVRLGTMFTDFNLGASATLGLVNSPLRTSNRRSKFQVYLFARGITNFVGYNALLQGGVFNRRSPYTIPSNKIERFTGQYYYGLVIKSGFFYLEYYQTSMTREFEYGDPEDWGGLKIGVRI
ncbi:lipid A deacylase LpxR family protein [Zunongwangia sp. HRR-M8]|uniref:lipid A deacylase LpxR family protein n=1 Tax=Zunongwangia sp. HRR-M8 TaxID=3015170 RepID=UPI0022DD8B82|nr:lipid A deacylase LpxR family protein [Zunongwangia sp. HRR-M8]WBL22840.1 lipid A deacylase LpxR family protein [Zunongwangia sp. HRR-M8]